MKGLATGRGFGFGHAPTSKVTLKGTGGAKGRVNGGAAEHRGDLGSDLRERHYRIRIGFGLVREPFECLEGVFFREVEHAWMRL